MARSKLSEQEQQQIVSTYRGSSATAVELAEQFQVSVSTISRILKENIEADEYQQLVNCKRSAARRKETEAEVAPLLASEKVFDTPAVEATSTASRTRRRSSSLGDPQAHQQVLPLSSEPEPTSALARGIPTAYADPAPTAEPELDAEEEVMEAAVRDAELPPEALQPQALELAAELEEELEDEDEEDEDDEDGDLEEDLEEDEEDANDFLENDPEAESLAEPGYQLQVLPLEDLIPPTTCYAVVDRYQELATRPLKEFFNFGSLPEGMDGANTLPIFDNHRVARRFSEMSRRGSNTYPPYRVIQFPGHMLEAVRTQLQNKGITHLLVDGQIYAL